VLTQTDKSDVVVIINSLDDEFQNLAIVLVEKYGLKSIVTDSNGKPGKGKNSLLKYFLETDYTHLIPVDGDDYLLPNAIEILSNTTKDHRIDVLGLINGLCLLGDNLIDTTEWFVHNEYMNRITDSIDPKLYRKFNLQLEKVKRAANEYGNLFNRFIVLSKKAASLINYEEELSGAEDVKQGLLLKLAQSKGTLIYKLLSSKNVYVYDVTEPGIYMNLLCKCDIIKEADLFWEGLSREEIEFLKSFQLEKIDD
jgi:hypothetical protein